MYKSKIKLPVRYTSLVNLNQLDGWKLLLDQEFELKDKIYNTLRKDNNPTAFIKNHRLNHNILVLSDYANKTFNNMNLLQAWQYKYKLPIHKAYYDILKKVGLAEVQYEYTKSRYKKTGKKSKIKPYFGKILPAHENYWKDYGIDIHKTEIKPVIAYTQYSRLYVCEDILCFWIPYSTDGKQSFKSDVGKVYRPNNPDKKWRGNVGNNHYIKLEGYRDSNTVILTSSYKDAKVLNNSLSLTTYSFISEVFDPKEVINPELLKEFKDKNVVIWMDHDKAGLKMNKKLVKYFISNDINAQSLTTNNSELNDPAAFFKKTQSSSKLIDLYLSSLKKK